MKKIKILFLINELQIGGTEKQLILMTNLLPKDRFEPIIGVLFGTDILSNEQIDSSVVNFSWKGSPFFKSLILINKLRKFIDYEKIDIVQTQFPEAEIHGSIAAKFSKVRPLLISTRRNLYHWIKERPVTFQILRKLVTQSDMVITNSYKVKERCLKIEKVPSEKIRVIQNAIDIDKFNQISSTDARRKLNLSSDAFIVGVLGNLRPVKGQKYFVKAAVELEKKIPEAIFILVGSGPQENELKKMTVELGINHKTIFLKNTTDVPTIISTFDVAVQSSLSESFSNVLLEYMASGKNVIATKVGDAKEIIDNGINGILISPKNHFQIIEAVLKIYNKSDFGEKAIVKVCDNWATSIIVDKYIKLYDHLTINKENR